MKTKCYSVRLESLIPYSEKAYKAVAFDGSTAFIPTNQVFGEDLEVQKSDAYWISAWILEQRNIQYSCKKVGWFDSDSREMLPTYHVEKHTPKKRVKVMSNEIKELKK
jgi:hypothetical protein